MMQGQRNIKLEFGRPKRREIRGRRTTQSAQPVKRGALSGGKVAGA